jgi:hypothetical protein
MELSIVKNVNLKILFTTVPCEQAQIRPALRFSFQSLVSKNHPFHV